MSDKSESKPRELWVNIYDNANRVYDCVGHLSLEKCAKEVAIYVKEQCVHVIEYSAFERLKSENEKLRKALENSLSTMEAVIEVNEDWSLAQERIGNKGICIPAIRKAREALAQADAVTVQPDNRDEMIRVLKEFVASVVEELPQPTEIESQLLVLGDFINWQKLRAKSALAEVEKLEGNS